MRMAVVIPAYNEARTVRAIAQRALRQSPLVIIVDDGSSDGTAEALAGLPVLLLRHAGNLGKAASLWDGFMLALQQGVDLVATIDADGQHQPEDLHRLQAVAHTNRGSIVIGARLYARQAAPMTRRFANRFADFWISWAAGYAIADSQSGARIYPAALLRQVEVRHDVNASFTLESEILIRAARFGYDSVAVPIATIYGGDARASHFRPWRDILRITRMVAGTLLGRRMHLGGLLNSLRRPPRIMEEMVSAPLDVVHAPNPELRPEAHGVMHR